MKRKLVLTITLLCILSMASHAAKVPQQDAAIAAKNFFFERITQYQNIDYQGLSLYLAKEIEYQGMVVYYAFNVSPEGYVLVSAWDQAHPFLAYSFNRSFDPGWQPENFSAWMEQYARQIYFAVDENKRSSAAASAAWEYYLNMAPEKLTSLSGREVEPLLTSTWDQGKYYNESCPADPAGPGGHCYAGCVATALGQVMNYFRWPETGTGSYSYSCPPYGTLSANFDSTTYHWNLMETNLVHSNLFIAELLYHLGVSVDMVFGPDGSGMYNHKGAYTLKTYFKYSPETQYVFRDSTSMDWDSLIVAHLDQSIPMYYAGWSVPNIYGHAFVCDGYQDSAYYHFNWGWGGSYDGYFYTDNLTPGGSNFNLAQELIIHAVPDTVNYTYPLYCEGEHEYETLYGTLEDGSGPLFPYPGQSDCQWLIAPADSINGISLEFLSFSLGENDTVKVYEGDDITAPLLATLVAGDSPGTLQTPGSSIMITFQSDGNGESPGFLAEFFSDLPVYCSGNTSLTGQTDTISDGSGGWDYQNNTQCMWVISPAGASELTLHFLDFDTEENFDFLRIYDMETSELLAEYSGSFEGGLPDPVTSPSGKMFIVFMTNYTVRAQGWTAYYETDLVGIDKPSYLNKNFMIYPNPSSGIMTVEMENDFGKYLQVTVRDIYGRTVYLAGMDNSIPKHQVGLNHLAPGLYYLTISRDKNIEQTAKIIIQ